MNHFRGVAMFRQSLRMALQASRNGAASRAAESNRQIAFALANVVRNQIDEQALDSLQEFAGLRERADVTRHAAVFS